MKIEFAHRYDISEKHEGLTRIECCGPNRCWAIGPGNLLRSDTAGRSWTNYYFSSPLIVGRNPHRISFHSPEEGILLAKDGPMAVHYFRSSDGGRTWSQVRRLDEGGYVWAELFALPKTQKVWSLIKRRGGETFIETVGAKDNTWKREPVSIQGEPRDIRFADESRGWILERWNKDSWIEGAPKVKRATVILHHTRDGGTTWEIVCKREWACDRLFLTDAGTLQMAGEDGIFLSGDEGASWDHVLDHPRVPLFDVNFRGLVGISLGTEDLIESKADTLLMISRDRGKTWNELETPAAEAFLGARLMTWSWGVLAATNGLYTFELS